jgi:hypothetical protein
MLKVQIGRPQGRLFKIFSLGKYLNIIKAALKIIFLRPGILEHVCNPSTWEEETGGSWVPGQPWDIERHCLQETKKAKTKILFLNP